jgi:hypothetical protein
MGLEAKRGYTTVTALYKIKPGVDMTGLKPEMAAVLDIVPVVFERKGYDCWVTSAVRPGDPGKHGEGGALDFDSSTNIPHDVGIEIQRSVKAYLGPTYGVLWHGPRWHLHTQHPVPGG